MPNQNVYPQAVLLVFAIGVVRDTLGFVVQIPEALLVEAKMRGANLAFQGFAYAVTSLAAGSSVNPVAPVKLFQMGLESLSNAKTPEEASLRGAIAESALVLSGVSSGDPNASFAFRVFLAALSQNILFRQFLIIPIGNHTAIGILVGFIFKRIILELQVEFLRRKYGLPPKLQAYIKQTKNQYKNLKNYLKMKLKLINFRVKKKTPMVEPL